MKKKFSAILMVILILAAGIFAFYASGHESMYIKNYSTNFKNNLYTLGKKMNLSKDIMSSLPTPVPTSSVPPQTPAPTATPIIPFAAQSPVKANIIEKSIIIPVKNAANIKFSVVGKYLIGLDKTSVSMYDKSGICVYSETVQLSSPILRTAGKYALAAEKNGKHIYLFVENKLIYSTEIENNIVSADVSENGDVVLVCEKDYYKGCVVVYNKNGELVYSWSSGADRVIDADICASNRKLAILTMSIDDSAKDENVIKSNVLWTDINQSEVDVAASYSGTLMYDIEFSGNELFVFGDNKYSIINSRKKVAAEVSYENKELIRYRINGYAATVTNINNLPYIEILNTSGKIYSNIKLSAIPDCIDINGSNLVYNDNRTITFSDINGKKSKNFTCLRDINDIVIVNNETIAIIYSSSIEFVNTNKA